MIFKQMVLKILGSNLLFLDKTVKIEAKNAFIFLKEMESDMVAQNLWLEPINVAKAPQKEALFANKNLLEPREGLEPSLP